MNKMNIEKKPIDRKNSLDRLRTVSAQTLEEVAGGREYLHYTFDHTYIGGY